MDFNQPSAAAGDKLDIENLNGRLLLIYPKEIKQGVATSFGPKDPLVADIVILDGPTAGEELRDAFIFPGVMIGQLKGYIGNPNPALGRVGYGIAKPGQKAPWQLGDFTPEDAAIASAWVNAHPRAFNSPAAAPAQHYTAPVDHQAAAAAQALEQQRQAAATASQFTQSAPPANVNTNTGEITAPAGGLNVATIRTLLGLAVPDQDIAAATGATLEQITAIRNLPAA